MKIVSPSRFFCALCNAKFIGKPSSEAHNNTIYQADTLHHCDSCYINFPSDPFLQQHNQNKHQSIAEFPNHLRFMRCRFPKRKISWEAHQEQTWDSHQTFFVSCNLYYTTDSFLERHSIENLELVTDFQCAVCKTSFLTEQGFNFQHLKIQFSTQIFKISLFLLQQLIKHFHKHYQPTQKKFKRISWIAIFG